MRNFYTFLPILFLFFSLFCGVEKSTAQICDPNVPMFNVNLTGNPDSTWVSPLVQRNEQCCGVLPPDICVAFTVTLDPNSVSIVFSITAGAVPPGALFYQVNCGPPVAVGDTICLNGVGPHIITFCKPGNNTNEYTIQAIEAPNAPDSITVRNGCSAEMVALGYYESSITWTSIFPGPPGTYNNYLSCVSACDTVTVTPQPGFPPFIDYVVSGLAQAPCTTVAGSDTIRVYIVADLTATINPQNPVICFGGSDTLLTVVPGGGLPPYSYLWSNGDTTASTLVGPGTYWVQVNDGTDCPPVYDTVVVGIFTLPITATAGTDQLICANSPPVQLNGGVVSASGGQWLNGSGNYSPGSTTLNATYTPSVNEINAGQATLVLVTTGNQGCPPDTDTVQIIITPLPVVAAGPDVTICSSGAATVSGQVSGGTTTGVWTSSGTGTFTPNNTSLNTTYTPSPADIANGTVTLVLTSTNNGGCPPETDTLVITIDEAPVVNAGPDQTICSNSTVTLNGQIPSGSGTGAWTTTGTGTFSPNNLALNATYNPGTADITNGSVLLILTSTANGSCPADADSVTVTITQLAVVNAGPPQTVCANNAQVALTGTISGGTTTGTWTSSGTGTFTPNNTSLNTTYTPSPADIANGTVTLVLTSTNNGGCPPETDTLVITIDEAPVVNAGPDQTICSNSTVTLNGQIPSGSGTGVWTTTGTGTFSPNNLALNATYNPGTADITNGSVLLILTSTANGSCPADADTVTVTISQLAVVNAGPSQTVCANNAQALLNGTISGITTTGQWSTSGSGTFAPNNTTLNSTYTPSTGDITSGSITLTLTSTANGVCPAVTDTMTIIITPEPVVSAGPDQTICSTSPAQLYGSVTGGSTTGQWTSSGSGTFSPNNTTLNATYTASPADIAAGSVTLTLQATNIGTCSPVSDAVIITIFDAPVVNAGPDQAICSNVTAVQLAGQVAGTSGTGSWSSSGTGTFSPGNNVLNATYSPSPADISAGSVTLILTSTNNGPCGSDNDTMVITIAPMPVANAGNNFSVCANNSNAFFNGTITGGSGSGLWTSSGSGTFLPNNTSLSGVYQPSAADIAAGSVTLTLTSTNNGGCPASTDILVITITPAPFVLAGADQAICAGSPPFALAGLVAGGATTGNWTSSGTGVFNPSSTALNATYTPSTADILAGSVMLILTSTNNGNCLAVSDTLLLQLVQPPTVTAGNDQSLCEDDLPFNLNATIAGGSGTGIWTTTGSGTFIPNPTSAAAVYVPSAADILAGSVVVTFTSTNNGPCGAASDGIVLTIHPSPVAAFSVNQTTVFLPNSPVVIINQSTGAGAYEWDFGDGSSTSLVNPQYQYTQVGTYTITLIATNSFGCDDTATTEIIATSDIVFPNAFTPGDGSTGGSYDPGSLDNNVFFPYTAGVEQYHLQIFNRWGELIFESFDLLIGWDGYYRGELCQQDTYVWKADVRFYDGRRFKKVGDVTLLR